MTILTLTSAWSRMKGLQSEDTAFTGGYNLEESREATCYLKFSLIKSVHNISTFSLGIFRNYFFE